MTKEEKLKQPPCKADIWKSKIDEIFTKENLETPIWGEGEGYISYIPKHSK
ncbi:hypothetical protein [Hoylesella nanceiensis]